MRKRSVVVADGHSLVRLGLCAVLQDMEGIEIVAVASDAKEAVRQTLALAPDLAVIDLQLPVEGGVWALRQIKAGLSQQRALLMGDKGHETAVRDALRSGCSGYMRKNAPAAELRSAVNTVLAGEVYLDADYSRQLVLADHTQGMSETAGPLTCLTERELTVFRLIGAGYTNRAAAERIRLSHKTVEKHRAAVMQKLRLRSAVDLRLMARELGVANTTAPSDAD